MSEELEYKCCMCGEPAEWIRMTATKLVFTHLGEVSKNEYEPRYYCEKHSDESED